MSRGINVGILCLGESKSGKSSSLGLSSKVGLVALTADTVFQHVEKFNHFVEVSYLNIYHEKFTDLLNPADKDIKVTVRTLEALLFNCHNLIDKTEL